MRVISEDIQLVDLKRQHAELADEIMRGFHEVLGGMQLFLGPNVRAFEAEFAQYLGAEYCVGVADGTSALYLALRACGVDPGDEVITVSHTFFATVEAILLAGAKPVFVDVHPDTYTMDVNRLEAAITDRTRAILPVHLYGRMADMEGVLRVARPHGLLVIEDAAQAHGACRNGHAAGTMGDAGCFSFYYSKNLGAYGEAGGVVTSDPAVAERLRALRDHGSEERYQHGLVGVNGRLDELQAVVLRAKLRRLDEWNERRREHARLYNEKLEGLPLRTPDGARGEDHVFHLYVVQCSERDALQQHLRSHRIATAVHYPLPCHVQPPCRPFRPRAGTLEVTENLAPRILSLPMFPELEVEEIDRVVEAIAGFYDRRASTQVDAAE